VGAAGLAFRDETGMDEPGVFQRVREIKRRSAALESTDDIIASNAAFLSLSSNWERLWHEEQQPVLRVELGGLVVVGAPRVVPQRLLEHVPCGETSPQVVWSRPTTSSPATPRS